MVTLGIFGKRSKYAIRMQGTLKDIRWFKGLMERHGEIKVKNVSKPFKNKGTDQYVRVYAEIEKEDK